MNIHHEIMATSIRCLRLWLVLQLLYSIGTGEAQSVNNLLEEDYEGGPTLVYAVPARCCQGHDFFADPNINDGLLYSACGRPTARRQRVVGGEDVYDGEFPWLVSIQLLPALGENKCGGTILNGRWILTAAHCFHGYSKSNFVVRVADFNLRRKELRPQQAITVAIEKLVVHPQYRKDRKYDNDIALIKLAKDIVFSPYSLPACLPTLRLASTAGINVTVIGWGKLAEAGKLPETPRKTSLVVFDNAQCNDWLASLRMRLLDNHLCAGVSKGGKDACQGDSGGPLMALEDGRYVVVGVVSTGYGCARPKTPGVYARVSSFLPWINNVIN